MLHFRDHSFKGAICEFKANKLTLWVGRYQYYQFLESYLLCQALQMTVWFARMISASLYAINWYRDDNESYVILQQLPHNSTYLLSVVTIEITVSRINKMFMFALAK